MSGQLVEVYVVNGTRTSRGPGPGPLSLPPAKAAALVRQRFAIYGDRPPNVPDLAPVAKPFTASMTRSRRGRAPGRGSATRKAMHR